MKALRQVGLNRETFIKKNHLTDHYYEYRTPESRVILLTQKMKEGLKLLIVRLDFLLDRSGFLVRKDERARLQRILDIAERLYEKLESKKIVKKNSAQIAEIAHISQNPFVLPPHALVPKPVGNVALMILSYLLIRCTPRIF